jgi:hypothetical protein
MTTHRQFTYDQIAKVFEYDPAEGKLYRNGHREVTLTRYNGNYWAANRVEFWRHKITVTHVIWMLQTQRWPTEGMFIDHIDGDVFNCRWLNLREATPTESSRNTDRAVAEDGLERGVTRKGNSYQVQLSDNGYLVYHGCYATADEANAVALRERLKLHGEFAFELSRGLLSTQQVLNLYREIVMPDLPAPVYDGQRFVFTRPTVVGPDYFAHAAVPQDTDDVDLSEADDFAVQDNNAAMILLVNRKSLPAESEASRPLIPR